MTPRNSLPRSVSDTGNVTHPPPVEDGLRSRGSRDGSRTRSSSVRHANLNEPVRTPLFQNQTYLRRRRYSHDTPSTKPKEFILDIDDSLKFVLDQEDTNGDSQIHVTDTGPKQLSLRTAVSDGFKTYSIQGNYAISSLIEELALAKDQEHRQIVISAARLSENPVERLSKRIKNTFWKNLTRRIDAAGLDDICKDSKNRSTHTNPRIYIPHGEPVMAEYYQKIARDMPHLNLEVEVLPPVPDDPTFVKSLNDKPGILALAMKEVDDGNGGKTLEGIPFVVPGARFNELYNWDSYFISLGLLEDGLVDLAKGMVDHFVFEITHYNKILNGSRSYYLCRTQPPFLTDMALQIYKRLDPANDAENRKWLKNAFRAAIKEYHTVWMSEPRFDPKTGLSRYRPDGKGIPPETEATHFLHTLQPYAEKHGISVNEFCEDYNDGKIEEPELDEYFLHDRSVRESGHDTTYRLEKCSANLGTVDLQALLYKYEVDIATTIRDVFGDELDLEEGFSLMPFPPTAKAYASSDRVFSTAKPQSSDEWFKRAELRKAAIDKYLWHEGKSLYFDYDTVANKQKLYESATAFWMLWAGAASDHQASKLVYESLKKFEVAGGLVSGTELSRGIITVDRPHRQWDYPYAWPPHQVLAWVGLEKYGYLQDAQRLAYRFIYMITAAFVDYHGVVPEKFDAVSVSHKVDAEYGNQGVDFKLVAREGFGWMNAAYEVGLRYLTKRMRRAVAIPVEPHIYFSVTGRAFMKKSGLQSILATPADTPVEEKKESDPQSYFPSSEQ